MTDQELMQQALDALEKHVLEYETAEALRARLAQPEPEPVAWIHPEWNTYTRAPAMSITKKEDWIPLYTAPPQREWQGLTDEEIKAIRVSCGDPLALHIEFARAIEAKLKEKNTWLTMIC